MQRTDSLLLQLKEIMGFIRTLDRAIPDPGTDITLIGGAAVTLLCADEERQTDDIDTLAGEALEIAIRVGTRQNPPVNINALPTCSTTTFPKTGKAAAGRSSRFPRDPIICGFSCPAPRTWP